MVGLANDGGRWAFFYLILLMVNVGFGSMYRGIAYIVPSYEAAQTAPGPFIAMQVIFAGFLIPPKHMARAALHAVRRTLSRASAQGTVVNGTRRS
jgi:ABC-type multidrug transport system permease subunit